MVSTDASRPVHPLSLEEKTGLPTSTILITRVFASVMFDSNIRAKTADLP